jgi:hypothetical protein
LTEGGYDGQLGSGLMNAGGQRQQDEQEVEFGFHKKSGLGFS